MNDDNINISMNTANRIFTCVRSHPDKPVLAVLRNASSHDEQQLEEIDEHTDFELSEDDLPILHSHIGTPTHERWIAVNTDTKGVLEIRGFKKTDQDLINFDIITV